MNYLLVENLSKSFGDKILFENITFGIDAGQKVALIARNGVGKSSLLNIIAGFDSPDTGEVTFRNDIKVSYLPQNPVFKDHLSVMAVLFDAENEMVNAIKTYEYALSSLKKEDKPAHHKAFEEAMATMDRLNAWDIESRIAEILGKFRIDDLAQTIGELSGGQKKKLALAKVLIQEVDLLILDEPTNHLDFEMIEWLEDYLSREKLSLLLVTHDRYFLDKVCDNILELENEKLYRYNGSYSYYLEKKAEREYNESAELEKIKSVYRRELEWIRRSPQARTTKSRARIEAFYELEEKASRRMIEKPAELKVKTERIGGKVLEVNNICKSYGKLKIVDDFSHTFKRGERIGIVGKNGAGKTTLLELIMGNIHPDKGRIVKGQTVQFGYFAQDGLEPSGEKRIIEIVKEIAEVIPLGKGGYMSAAQFLYHFGFSYATQYNYYYNLSGGERRKLYLLMTLMKNPNFLLLDEPTNDLDIFTLNILEDFLIHFDGCVMFVSHDRFFIDKLADHVFVFEGNGKIKDYYGSYSEYHRQRVKMEVALKRKMNAEKLKKEYIRTKDDQPKLSYKQKQEFESLEKEIEMLEEEKSLLLKEMSREGATAGEIHKCSVRFSEIEGLLEIKTIRWLELGEYT